jgi:hypothetical protein
MTNLVTTSIIDNDTTGRQQLYLFLNELQRSDLASGTTDFARLDRVLILLAARGIRWNEPRSAKWLAPVLCRTPAEQALFHRRFRDFVSKDQEDSAFLTPPAEDFLTSEEVTIDEALVRERRFGGSAIWGFWVAGAVALTFGGYYLVSRFSSSAQTPSVSLPPSFFTVSDLLQFLFSLILTATPLLLVPVFVRWHRSRQLALFRAFAPTSEKVEKVAFATALPLFYSSLQLKRALSAMRRHWAAPGGSLNIKRTIRATMRAGGRPELRYGVRPRTPEYVFLVDQETPQDHLFLMASMIVRHFREEHIIVTRYAFYGDPRRVIRISDSGATVQHLHLEDIAALHPNSTTLLFAEPSIFLDAWGNLYRWAEDLKEWSRAVVLSPRPSENRDWREHRLEQHNIFVFSATTEGLEAFCSQLRLGPIPLLADEATSDGRAARANPNRGKRVGSSAGKPASSDLVDFLDAERVTMLEDTAPRASVSTELLADLQLILGSRAFALLQALAVFPKLEPALTIHIGSNLKWKDVPLLDEHVLLLIARLPWLRVGYMPEWLRKALVQRLDKGQLAEILGLFESFLRPLETRRTNAISFEIARHRESKFRRLLLGWIERDPTGELDDRILVDALRGRDPKQLGVPVPKSLGERLRRQFRGSEWNAIALAIAAAGLIWLFHESIVDIMLFGWNRVGGSNLLSFLANIDLSVFVPRQWSVAQSVRVIEWIIPGLLLFVVAWTRFNLATNRSGTTFASFYFGVTFYYALIVALWLLIITLLGQGSIGFDLISQSLIGANPEAGIELTQHAPILAALIIVVASQFPRVSQIDVAARSFCTKIAAIPREADQLAFELARLVEFQPPSAQLRSQVTKIISENISAAAVNFKRDGSISARFTRAVALYELFVAPRNNGMALEFASDARTRSAYVRITQLGEAVATRADARYEELMETGLAYFASQRPTRELKEALTSTITEVSDLVCSLIARYVLDCNITRGGRRRQLSKLGFEPNNQAPFSNSPQWMHSVLAVTVFGASVMALFFEPARQIATLLFELSNWIIPGLLLFFVAWTRFNSPPTNRSGTTFALFFFGVTFYYALIVALWLLIIIFLSQGSIGFDWIGKLLTKANPEARKDLAQYAPIFGALIIVVASQFRQVSRLDVAARSFCVSLAAIPREADRLALELARLVEFQPPSAQLRSQVTKIISANISPAALNFKRDGTVSARFTRAVGLHELFVAPRNNGMALEFASDARTRSAYVRIAQLGEAVAARADARYEELTQTALAYFASQRPTKELTEALTLTITEFSTLVCGLIARYVLYCSITRSGRRQQLSEMGFGAKDGLK